MSEDGESDPKECLGLEPVVCYWAYRLEKERGCIFREFRMVGWRCG